MSGHARHTRRLYRILILLAFVLFPGSAEGFAQEGSPNADEAQPASSLVVGVKEAEPFVVKQPDGGYTGISIDLWEAVAAGLGTEFEYRETDLEGLIDGVANNSFDVAVAALTITQEREERVDFTHPFFTTGLGIAVKTGGVGSWFASIRGMLSAAFVTAVGALAGLLLVVGFLLWLFERRKNKEQFGGRSDHGLGSAFWWAAVTMTTVGYGDKAPITVGGRFVALVWMFASIIIISGFTGAIASTLTVGQLGSSINGPDDLRGHIVGTIAGSTSEDWLSRHGVARERFDTPLAGLQALKEGEIDAMVYDAPILRYLAKTELEGQVHVLPSTFTRQDYGFALADGSLLREEINRIILDEIAGTPWQSVLESYLGK